MSRRAPAWRRPAADLRHATRAMSPPQTIENRGTGAGTWPVVAADRREGLPVLRMKRGFSRRQDRAHAGVRACETPGPLVPCAGAERLGEPRPRGGPGRLVHLRVCTHVVGQAQAFQKLAVELGLDGAHGDVAAVGRLVAAVERRSAVQHVVVPGVVPGARGPQAIQHGREAQGSFQDAARHHLALSRRPGQERGREHAHGELHGAPAEIGDQVQRHGRRRPRLAHRGQRAGQAEKVQVMPGLLRHRPGVAPAGQSAIDQSGIAGEACLRAKADTFHHAGPEPLDQDVGRPDQLQRRAAPCLVLEVERRRPLAAGQGIEPGRNVNAQAGCGRAINAQHVRAKLGKHQAAMRHRADCRHFDHPHPGQGSGSHGARRHQSCSRALSSTAAASRSVAQHAGRVNQSVGCGVALQHARLVGQGAPEIVHERRVAGGAHVGGDGADAGIGGDGGVGPGSCCAHAKPRPVWEP